METPGLMEAVKQAISLALINTLTPFCSRLSLSFLTASLSFPTWLSIASTTPHMLDRRLVFVPPRAEA